MSQTVVDIENAIIEIHHVLADQNYMIEQSHDAIRKLWERIKILEKLVNEKPNNVIEFKKINDKDFDGDCA